MPYANCYHIENALIGLYRLDQPEWERIARLDDMDKGSFKDVMARYVLPSIKELTPLGRSLLKESLRYCLIVRPAEVRRMMDNMQDSPVGGMDDPYPMFEALWEVAFPDEPYAATDVSAYVEDHDMGTGNEIFAPEGGWKP
jgi:hypothetical protein